MTKIGQRVVALLLATLCFITILPVHNVAKADDSRKTIEGLVIWGTSGVSRMYGDLYGAKFGTGSGDSTGLGMYNALQHEWASYHSASVDFEDPDSEYSVDPLGGGYDYLNLGKFTNYWVQGESGALPYAVLADDHKGWSASNKNDLRVSSGQTSYYSSQTVGTAGWREGAIRSLREAITRGVRGTATHDSLPQNWDIDKTAVAIWAGEDWVVRNKDSNDAGLPSSSDNAKHLQWYWMGLGIEPDGDEYDYYNHYFDPCPGKSKIDKHGDVLHQYVDGGLSEVMREVPLATMKGAHYATAGLQVKECEHDNWKNCNRLNDVNNIYAAGDASSGSGYRHSLVFYNSYMIRDFLFSDWKEDGNPGLKDEPHMDLDSGFGYNYEEDGITRSIDHIMTEISDKLPGEDGVKLATQAGICFGRVLCGYGYSVEYLEQDVSWGKNEAGTGYDYDGPSTSVMTDENGEVVYQTEKDPITGETLYEPELGENGTPLYLTKKGVYAEEGHLPDGDEFELDDYGRKIQKDAEDPNAYNKEPVNKYILQDGKRIPVYLTADGKETTNPEEAAQATQKKQATDAAGKPKYSGGQPVYVTPTGEETTDPEAAAEETVPVRATEQETRIPVYKRDAEGEKIAEEGASVDRNSTYTVWCCIFHPAVYNGVEDNAWISGSWGSLYGDQDSHYDTLNNHPGSHSPGDGSGVNDSGSHRFAVDGRYHVPGSGNPADPNYWTGQAVDTEDSTLLETYNHGPDILSSTDMGPPTQVNTHTRDRYIGTDTMEGTIPKSGYGGSRGLWTAARNVGYGSGSSSASEDGTYYIKKVTKAYAEQQLQDEFTDLTITYRVTHKNGTYRTVYTPGSVSGFPAVGSLSLKEGDRVSWRYSGHVVVSVDVDVYKREVEYETYTPAWYEWFQIEIPLHERCDYDLKSDTGYADAWHTHQYGGIGGFTDGFKVDPELDDDDVKDGIVNKIPTEPEENDFRTQYAMGAEGLFADLTAAHADDPAYQYTYGVWHEIHIDADKTLGMDTSTLTSGYHSASDHGDDFTEIQTWFTHPDKPIMKSISEGRAVRGYIDYLQDWFGQDNWNDFYSDKKGSLKFYVFGLGAYNKAYYEDMRDEIWSDGETAPDSNNTGTASMTSSGDPGPAAKYKEIGGRIDEIKRTDRIEDARKAFGQALKSSLRLGAYVDMYEITADWDPYFRYQAMWTSAKRGKTEYIHNAQHGKWYDENTSIRIFEVIWNTILADNPEDPYGEPISASFYAAASALATYTNGIVGARGRNIADTEKEQEAADEAAETGESAVEAPHSLQELIVTSGGAKTSAGIAGVAMGYGDESYDFKESYTTHDTATSSAISYAGILGLEDRSGKLSEDSGMYLYSQYGKLLMDLGIDEVGAEDPVSARTLPGLVMSGAYIGNSSLSILWSTTIDLLRTLNPFSILSQCTEIANSARASDFTGSSQDAYANHWLKNMAEHNPVLQDFLGAIGKIYDTLSGSTTVEVDDIDPFSHTKTRKTINFSMVALYLALFIGGSLLFYNRYKANGQMWSRTKVLLIRFVFILIGIPLIANMYTAILDGFSQELSVVGSPATEMVSSTLVDFGGWVRASRLAPPENSTLAITVKGSPDAGVPAGNSMSNMRKTAWAINQTTGAWTNVQMTTFGNAELSNVNGWANAAYVEYDPTKPAVATSWLKNTSTVSQVWSMLRTWMNSSYYYSSVFESDTLAAFSANNQDMLGNIPDPENANVSSRGEDESSGEPTGSSPNTLYELFSESTVEQWDARSLAENTDILTGSRWSSFSIYTNGGLKASINGSLSTSGGDATITYTKGQGENVGHATGADKYREGLDLTVNTGGLSSLAMYNYLSSNFGSGGVYVYSSGRSPSGYTEKAHYRVNVIGSGIMEVLFFANCMLFILAGVIIGFCYSLMMCISVLKQGFSVLVSIPGALLGVMKSIATVVATVIAMLLEILVSIGLYTVVSELLMSFSALLEGPLTSAIQNLAAYGAISQPLMISDASYVAHLCVSTVFFGVFGVVAYMFAPKALRVWDKLISVIFMMILGRAPEKKAVKVRERRYAGEPVGSAVYKLFM